MTFLRCILHAHIFARTRTRTQFSTAYLCRLHVSHAIFLWIPGLYYFSAAEPRHGFNFLTCVSHAPAAHCAHSCVIRATAFPPHSFTHTCWVFVLGFACAPPLVAQYLLLDHYLPVDRILHCRLCLPPANTMPRFTLALLLPPQKDVCAGSSYGRFPAVLPARAYANTDCAHRMLPGSRCRTHRFLPHACISTCFRRTTATSATTAATGLPSLRNLTPATLSFLRYALFFTHPGRTILNAYPTASCLCWVLHRFLHLLFRLFLVPFLGLLLLPPPPHLPGFPALQLMLPTMGLIHGWVFWCLPAPHWTPAFPF